MAASRLAGAQRPDSVPNCWADTVDFLFSALCIEITGKVTRRAAVNVDSAFLTVTGLDRLDNRETLAHLPSWGHRSIRACMAPPSFASLRLRCGNGLHAPACLVGHCRRMPAALMRSAHLLLSKNTACPKAPSARIPGFIQAAGSASSVITLRSFADQRGARACCLLPVDSGPADLRRRLPRGCGCRRAARERPPSRPESFRLIGSPGTRSADCATAPRRWCWPPPAGPARRRWR